MTKQQIIYDYALSFIGVPYSWNGKNPLSGFDCSGLVFEIASAIGLVPPSFMSAQQLYDYYFGAVGDTCDPQFGALLFFGKSSKEIDHIAFGISPSLMIEAASGDHTTLTRELAAIKGAFVKVRPVRHRIDFLSAVMPNWPEWNS